MTKVLKIKNNSYDSVNTKYLNMAAPPKNNILI